MIYRVITACIFFVAVVLIVGYARGYRLDINNTELSSRGLVAVTSSPRSAKIFVNGALKGVTDTSLYLEPGTFTINIVKDGYFPWKKTVKIQGEVVQSVDATLYPINASLSPLTNIGISRAIPFGVDGKKVLLFSTTNHSVTTETPTPNLQPSQVSEDKAGIFVYDPRTQAVSLFPSLTYIVDYDVLGTEVNPQNYDVLFSPNFDQAILFYNPTYLTKPSLLIGQLDPTYVSPDSFDAAYLVGLNELNSSPLDITNSALSLVEAWSMQKRANLTPILAGYKQLVKEFIGNSTKIVDISPDKTRILYEATASSTLAPVLKQPLIGTNQTEDIRTIEKGTLYAYDTREDRNYLVLSQEDLSRQHAYPLFHPNSKNIVLNEEKSISFMDYDGLNKNKLYSGPYDESFFAVTSDGRMLILTNFNSTLNNSLDLYAVGIK